MAKVDKQIVDYLAQVKSVLRSHTDWQSGYEATDLAAECVMALAKRQCQQGDTKSSNFLLDGLVQFRADLEKALGKKYKTDADGLRYNAKVPVYIKYDLGLIDLLIGCLMPATGRVNIIHRNVSEFLEQA